MRLERSHPKGRLGFAGAGLAIVVLGVLGLLALSTPKAAEARLAAADTALAKSSKVISTAGDLARYPPHAICDDAARGANALRGELSRLAASSKVTLGDVRLEPSAAPEQMLATLALDITAKGDELPAKVFLGALSRISPLLIVDGLDFSSDGRETKLRLKARALCHERRLP